MKAIIIKIFLTIIIIPLLLIFSTCKDPDNDYYDIPDVYVNYLLNMDLPQYADLKFPGGFVYVANEGYNGIIVYHTLDDQYIALERTCTYQPLEECSVIYADDSGLFLRCGKEEGRCCDSKFEMDGTVLKGPALYPLKPYLVSRMGNNLTITSVY